MFSLPAARHRRPRRRRMRRVASLALVGAAAGITVIAPLEAGAASLTVVKGHRLVADVPGFAPGAVVSLRLDRVVDAGTSRADRTGTVHVAMPAPATLGRHQLMLVGAIPSTRPPITADGAASDADPQSVVVVVPRLVRLGFRVVPSLGVDAEQTDRGHAGTGPGGNDHGTDGRNSGRLGTEGESVTADTGTNLQLPALIGSALVIIGAAATTLGRRRSGRAR